MIIAPDVFAIEQGRYTPQIAVDWFTDPRLGRPTPLFTGRTLRYCDDRGWEVAPTTRAGTWKSLDSAAKTVKAAFKQADTLEAVEGYYELIGPKLAKNPHGLDGPALVRHGGVDFAIPTADIPRTSLYAWPSWLAKARALGVLWIDDSTEEPRYAAVNAAYMPTP